MSVICEAVLCLELVFRTWTGAYYYFSNMGLVDFREPDVRHYD